MQDLLNEGEFIAKKSDYNPWRRFGVFYGIAMVYIIGLYIFGKIVRLENEILLVISFFGIPFLMSFVMVFHKKSIITLPYKIIAVGVLGFQAVITTSIVTITLSRIQPDIAEEDITMCLIMMAAYLALGLLCFALMYPILRYKRKRLKQRP